MEANQIIFLEFHNKIGPNILFQYPEDKQFVEMKILLQQTFSADYCFTGNGSTYSFSNIQINNRNQQLFAFRIVVPDQYQRAFIRKFAIVLITTQEKRNLFHDIIIDVCEEISSIIHNGLMIQWEKEKQENIQTIRALLKDKQLLQKVLPEVHIKDSKNDIEQRLHELLEQYDMFKFKQESELEKKSVLYLLSKEEFIKPDLKFDQEENAQELNLEQLCVRFKKLQLSQQLYLEYRDYQVLIEQNRIHAIKQILQRFTHYIQQPIYIHRLNEYFIGQNIIVFAGKSPLYAAYPHKDKNNEQNRSNNISLYQRIFRPDITVQQISIQQQNVLATLNFSSAAADQYNEYVSHINNVKQQIKSLIYLQKRWQNLFPIVIYFMISKRPVVLVSQKNQQKRNRIILDGLQLLKIQFAQVNTQVKDPKFRLSFNCISKVLDQQRQIEQAIKNNTGLQIFQVIGGLNEFDEFHKDCALLLIDTDQDVFTFQRPRQHKLQFLQSELDELKKLLEAPEQYLLYLQNILRDCISEAQKYNFGMENRNAVCDNSKIFQSFLLEGIEQSFDNVLQKQQVKDKWWEYEVE